MTTLAYQAMGVGPWVSAIVSPEVAVSLAKEYRQYGWPVKVNNIDFE